MKIFFSGLPIDIYSDLSLCSCLWPQSVVERYLVWILAMSVGSRSTLASLSKVYVRCRIKKKNDSSRD